MNKSQISSFFCALATVLAFTSTGLAEQKTSDSGSDSESSKAVELAKKVQAFYKKTKDFQATFKQIYTDPAAGDKKTHHGKVFFKKPGKMRWDYHKSKESNKRQKVIVSDGSTLWIYEYEFKQVFKRCLGDSDLPTALGFLMGTGNLIEDFNIEFADRSTDDAPVLQLVPKKATSKYKKLTFEVDKETHRVEKTTIYDPYGNTNEFNFKEVSINQDLPNSGFEFDPPENARVLNRNKNCQ
jgi:outer membrane lipoprotein carrier protein